MLPPLTPLSLTSLSYFLWLQLCAEMVQCEWCSVRKAVLRRPKTGSSICKECFFEQFEDEIHQTIVSNQLFKKGMKVAIGASGGKGSEV